MKTKTKCNINTTKTSWVHTYMNSKHFVVNGSERTRNIIDMDYKYTLIIILPFNIIIIFEFFISLFAFVIAAAAAVAICTVYGIVVLYFAYLTFERTFVYFHFWLRIHSNNAHTQQINMDRKLKTTHFSDVEVLVVETRRDRNEQNFTSHDTTVIFQRCELENEENDSKISRK